MALKSEVIKTSFSVYSEEMTDLMIDEFTAYTPQLWLCVRFIGLCSQIIK